MPKRAQGRGRNGRWPNASHFNLFPDGEVEHVPKRHYLEESYVPLQDRFQPDPDDDIPQPSHPLERYDSMGRYIPQERRRMYRYGDRAFGRVYPDLNGPRLQMTRRQAGNEMIDQ
jgi:hypothetical protein